jgi:hypothetical protein
LNLTIIIKYRVCNNFDLTLRLLLFNYINIKDFNLNIFSKYCLIFFSKETNEAQYPQEYEHQFNKDIEYEDETQIGLEPNNNNVKPQYHQYFPASKIQSLHNLYNANAYPGLRNFTDGSVPESACTRPGLFQHPNDCNKYYECYWDKYINKFTLHSFECPVKLAFDSRIVGCGVPNDPTICVQY